MMIIFGFGCANLMAQPKVLCFLFMIMGMKGLHGMSSPSSSWPAWCPLSQPWLDLGWGVGLRLLFSRNSGGLWSSHLGHMWLTFNAPRVTSEITIRVLKVFVYGLHHITTNSVCHSCIVQRLVFHVFVYISEVLVLYIIDLEVSNFLYLFISAFISK